MNRKKKSHEEWLDRKNYGQLEWTSKFLGLSKGPLIGGADYDNILRCLIKQVTTPEQTERMRKLWRLEKHRKHSGLKNCNFALTQQSASKLRKIAGKRPLRHVLAELIENEVEYETRLKKIDEDAREKVNAAECSVTKKLKLVSMRSETGLELARTQKELDILSIKVFYLLGEVSKRKVIMKNNRLFINNLTDGQQEEAEALSNKMKEEFFGNRLTAVEELVRRLAARQEVKPDPASPDDLGDLCDFPL